MFRSESHDIDQVILAKHMSLQVPMKLASVSFCKVKLLKAAKSLTGPSETSDMLLQSATSRYLRADRLATAPSKSGAAAALRARCRKCGHAVQRLPKLSVVMRLQHESNFFFWADVR